MTSAAASPLDEAQLQVLGETRRLARKLRFARGLALMNASSLGVIAAFSVLFELLDGGLPWVGLALAGVAWNEARGRAELAAAEPRGARRLMWNQLALLALVLVYCAVQAYQAWSGPDPLSALSGQSAELAGALKDLELQGQSAVGLGSWARTAALLAYAGVAALSALLQGLSAWYYAAQRRTVEQLASMPAWARALG